MGALTAALTLLCGMGIGWLWRSERLWELEARVELLDDLNVRRATRHLHSVDEPFQRARDITGRLP